MWILRLKGALYGSCIIIYAINKNTLGFIKVSIKLTVCFAMLDTVYNQRLVHHLQLSKCEIKKSMRESSTSQSTWFVGFNADGFGLSVLKAVN